MDTGLLSAVIGLAGLIFALILFSWIKTKSHGTDLMKTRSHGIAADGFANPSHPNIQHQIHCKHKMCPQARPFKPLKNTG